MSALLAIFGVVSDDVCFLQEQSHVVGKLQLVAKPGPFESRLTKQPRQTFTHQACNKVTVQIKITPSCHTQILSGTELDITSHTGTHLSGDIADHSPVPFIQQLILRNDLVELDQKQSILFVRTRSVEVPTWLFEILEKIDEERDLARSRDRHVVFDSVESAKDEIEETDDSGKVAFEFFNDSSKGARGEIEECPAITHSFAIPTGFGGVGFDIVERVSPDFVPDHCSEFGWMGHAQKDIGEDRHLE